MAMKIHEYEINLGTMLKRYRKEHCIKPSLMADYLSTEKSNYYKIERGERGVKYGQLMKFVEKTRMSHLDYLNLTYIPRDQSPPPFLVLELVMKLILIREGRGKSEGIQFSEDEEEFMLRVKENFKKKFPGDPFTSL